MAWVYILESERDGRFYVGSTLDLNRRISQHQHGHTQTTAGMGVIKLVFSQEFKTLEEARAIEKRLKRLKRKDYLQKIVAEGYIRIVS